MPSFFTYADNKRIPPNFSVIMNNAPPSSTGSDFKAWPATELHSFDIDQIADNASGFPEIVHGHFIWCGRIHRDTSNATGLVGGHLDSRFSDYLSTTINVDQGGDVRKARWNYTTAAKARGATVAHVMRSCGYTDAQIIADTYVSAGWSSTSDFLEWDVLEASPETYCTDSSGGASNRNEFWAHTDTRLWMPPANMSTVGAGNYIKLDYEVQDGTTEAETLALITHIAGLVHAKGFKLAVWCNSPGEDGAIYSGVTENNLYAISQVVDELSLIAWNNGDDTFEGLIDQMWEKANTGGAVDPSKISMTFSLGNPSGNNTTLENARYLRRWMQRHGVSKVHFWRNGATQGDASATNEVNQKIAAIVFGEGVPRPSAAPIF